MCLPTSVHIPDPPKPVVVPPTPITQPTPEDVQTSPGNPTANRIANRRLDPSATAPSLRMAGLTLPI
jgi:hypothetical protein